MNEKIVLVTDHTWPSTEPEARVLAEVGARLLVAETGSEEELQRLVRPADAILTCFARVPASVIGAAAQLQVIGRYGIGVDNIDVEEATRRGILVTNVPAYCLDEVAEHAMALLLACARKICRYDSAVRADDWALRKGMPVYRVRGRTLGIIGFGKIGQTLARRALGFGLRVVFYDPLVAGKVAWCQQAEPVALEELLALSDFVSLHAPLNAETRRLIDGSRLRKMKPTSFLINTARGGLLDQEALVEALRSGWIAGAALDVFEPERLPLGHPLLSLPNVIATPHVAFYSEESVLELETQAARNVADVLAGRRPESVVNPQVLELPRWAHLQSASSAARPGPG